MKISENEKARRDFVRGALATAQSQGVSKARIKQDCFSSYATGNRRIEHKQGELTLTDLCNMAAICNMSPAAFILAAAENMKQ